MDSGESGQMLQRMLYSEPDIWVQLLNLGILIPVVYAALYLFRNQLMTWGTNKPWMHHVRQSGKQRLKSRSFCDDLAAAAWVSQCGVTLHHAVCALLLLPAVCTPMFQDAFGFSDALVFALARHAGAVEVAWEIGDIAQKVHEQFFVQDRRSLKPSSPLVQAILHHLMASLLVVPNNIWIPTDASYIRLCFALEASAAILCTLSQMSQTLDVNNFGDVNKLFWNSFMLAAGMVVMRLALSPLCVYALVATYYRLGWNLMALVMVLTGITMLLADLLYTRSAVKRVTKFGSKLQNGRLGVTPKMNKPSWDSSDSLDASPTH
eukprot:CAMPEP_0174304016 /NCGR_PEP_ID=MMETSP0809-20121228/60530_1 /TAXON_ID=73025 ORGANISM="Eutreptiella gymnastica-like, Strain CCMP1594" /NCGR_SAMPLE_ID=MMETSP0809 /ASSEMBLY_ACC=CAM_ASM_000658 /LENGTH=319 /DNA_ID=CAMNT_0015410149 /DNA_START=35 /DNA_END=994 /DNA_ORIENTATION=-